MREPTVVLRGISKGFGTGEARVEVLRSLDLEVAKGEMLAVVGPSGVGKSTLLHIIGLVEEPDSGHLYLQGMRVDQLGERERARLRRSVIGFVFQHHCLLEELTAQENVALPLRIAGLPRREAMRRAAEKLESVGLGQKMRMYPPQLSGGEMQRVAVARALVHKPKLLLADEPTGNLDSAHARKVFELIKELHLLHGLTSIIVTHNEELASRCDRIFRLAGAGGE